MHPREINLVNNAQLEARDSIYVCHFIIVRHCMYGSRVTRDYAPLSYLIRKALKHFLIARGIKTATIMEHFLLLIDRSGTILGGMEKLQK